MAETMVQKYYSSIVDPELPGLKGFKPEDFKPCPGQVLVVIPPKITRVGNIFLPEMSQEDQVWCRVACVPGPEDPYERPSGIPTCPYKPGEILVFRPGAGEHMQFGGRKDLVLLSYEYESGDIYGSLGMMEPEVSCEEDSQLCEEDSQLCEVSLDE